MCGIAGYYCWGEARPPVKTIQGLLLDNEKRGKDAAGVAYLKDGAIRVAKEGQKAESFVKLLSPERWNVIAESPVVLLHARNKTKGPATANENNHPVFGLSWVVTHNGMITNDDELFDYYEQKRFAEVDTAALPLVLSKGKNFLDSLHQTTTLQGSVTAAVWSDNQLDRIALIRLGSNDLFLFYDEGNRILYWSSTFSGANSVPHSRIGPLRFATMSHLAEDRIVVLEPEGAQILKIKRNAFSPPRKYGYHPHVATARQQTTQTTAGTRSSKAVVDVSESSTEHSTYKWCMYAEEHDPIAAIKPHPMAAGVIKDRAAYLLEYVQKRFRDQPRLPGMTLETGYGNWIFTRIHEEGVAFVERMFKPHKRIKKFWAEYFQESLEPDQFEQLLKLPWSLAKLPTPLDGKLAIEGFNETIHKPSWAPNSSYSIPGFMCPWCGIHGRGQTWQKEEFRCWFCNIRSVVWTEATEKPLGEGVIELG